MTSKLTRERLEELAAGQSGFNLRIATLEESQELARMSLAAFDSEPVILYRQVNPTNGMKTYWAELDPEEFRHLKKYADENAEFMTLYRHAQQPVVMDDLSIFEAAIEECKTCDSIDEHAWNHGVLAVMAKYDACRAAMLTSSTQSSGSEPATVPGKWIPVSERMPDCWCRTCRPVAINDMRFVVCPDCGNKRCPRANDHRNACTGSNEPGQEGSAYPADPQEVKSE